MDGWSISALRPAVGARSRRSVLVRRRGTGKIVAIDLLPMAPLPGVEFIELDFRPARTGSDQESAWRARPMSSLSDMAANATGHRQDRPSQDHGTARRPRPTSRREVLAPGGAFLCKVLQGGTETTLLAALKRDFASVKHVKPSASRADLGGALSPGDRDFAVGVPVSGPSPRRLHACLSSASDRSPRSGPRPAQALRRASSAPASAGIRAKTKNALPAITAMAMKAGWKSAAAVMVDWPRAHKVRSTASCADGDPDRDRYLLSDRDQRGGAAHAAVVDVGVGDGIEAGEFERAEEAADDQHADDPRE